jgi:dephospho-CoA kinase
MQEQPSELNPRQTNPAARQVDLEADLERPNLDRVIGLTGGVGMGKTTVSDYLQRRYHLPILDADLYARQAVAPDSVLLGQIAERYGRQILKPDGSLDRARLGELVFSNRAERLWLEQQIHPFVRQQIEQELKQLDQAGQKTAVLVVPLLFEARMTDLTTEIWVVYTADQQQVERLQQRDRLQLDQIHARINSQMPIQKKLAQADVVLENTSSPEALFEQIDRALVTTKSSSTAGRAGYS